MKLLLMMAVFFHLHLAKADFFMAGQVGVSDAEIEGFDINVSTELSYGLRMGYLVDPQFSFGLYINKFVGQRIESSRDVEVDFTNYMLEATYYVREAKKSSFWVSALVGMTQGNMESSSLQKFDGSNFTLGAAAGFQFPIHYTFAMGPTLSLVYIGSGIYETTGQIYGLFWF